MNRRVLQNAAAIRRLDTYELFQFICNSYNLVASLLRVVDICTWLLSTVSQCAWFTTYFHEAKVSSGCQFKENGQGGSTSLKEVSNGYETLTFNSDTQLRRARA